MNPVKAIIKFIVNDVKQDIKIMFNIITGKYVREDYKAGRILPVIRENRWIPTIMIGMFFLGMFCTAKYYQVKCNDFIMENYIEPGQVTLPSVEGNLINYSFEELNINASLPFVRNEAIT